MNMFLPYKAPGWKTAPISPTCEQLEGGGFKDMRQCGKPTDMAYPAHGGGWMALCKSHGEHHRPHIFWIDDVIASGEKFDLAPLDANDGHIICECCSILTVDEMAAGYEVNGKPVCEKCWQEASDSQ